MADQDGPLLGTLGDRIATRRPVSLSCLQCRSRKLKCDRTKPSCQRCLKTGSDCIYPARRKAHPDKLKLIEELERKLANLQDLASRNAAAQEQGEQPPSEGYGSGFDAEYLTTTNDTDTVSTPQMVNNDLCQTDLSQVNPNISLVNDGTPPSPSGQTPIQAVAEVLTSIYFEKSHVIFPILHPSRYKESLLSAEGRPPLCLQYIVCALAAMTSAPYRHSAMSFYRYARVSAESDEMNDQGEQHLTLAHVQCWSLIANFEAQQTMFSRSGLSLGRGIRIAQMLQLHQLDKEDGKPTQNSATCQSWFEIEERRRIWWALYLSDRVTSATTGWPALINEQDVDTRLPISDEAFVNNTMERTGTLASLLRHDASEYSAFAGKIVAAHLFHKTMEHTSRNLPNDKPEDLKNGPYWKRHRQIDNDLTNFKTGLPSSLRLPRNFRCYSAAFINIIIHTSTICLHRAALWKMRSLEVPDHITYQSDNRLLPAAQEILGILRIIPDLQTALQNPILSFSAFMAALIFLEDFITDHDSQNEDDLNFLLHTMIVLGKNNSVSKSFAKQLATQMRQIGIDLSMDEDHTDMDTPSPLVATRGPNSPTVAFYLSRSS
ncbi:fungal-specific transcription factor domain-containing protein [Xylariales sp. PMI_506]|nr:fungal-specific transcription factor domain-containing protein [Xylariales sp. PMI_506]